MVFDGFESWLLVIYLELCPIQISAVVLQLMINTTITWIGERACTYVSLGTHGIINSLICPSSQVIKT